MEIVVLRRQPLISTKLRLQMCYMVIPFGRFLFNKEKYYLAYFLIQATMDFSGWPRLPEITSFSSTTYRKNRQERTCQKILIPWYWDGSQRGTLRGLSKHSIKSFRKSEIKSTLYVHSVRRYINSRRNLVQIARPCTPVTIFSVFAELLYKHWNEGKLHFNLTITLTLSMLVSVRGS